jgi:hypothetical protein
MRSTRTAGADHIYQTMNQAGIGLADQAARAIELDRQPASFIEV